MVVIKVRPHIAVWIRDEIAGIVLEQHRWVLTPPATKGEGHQAPRRVLVELREATGDETTEKGHLLFTHLFCVSRYQTTDRTHEAVSFIIRIIRLRSNYFFFGNVSFHSIGVIMFRKRTPLAGSLET